MPTRCPRRALAMPARHCSTVRRLKSPSALPAILLRACEMMSWKSPYRRRCRRYGGSLRRVWRAGKFKTASRAVCVHLRGAFIQDPFKSLASDCVQRCGERFGADVDTRPKESIHAVHESSGTRRHWRGAGARSSSRARQCVVAQQSRRRRGGSGRRPAGDNGSALAASPPSPLASLAPPSSSPLAPLVSAAV